MLTKLTIRNFKRFDEAEVELGNPVVLIGPNNSGKSTALQALALWHIGLKRWNEKRKDMKAPEKRPGVTINRRDLIAVPVPRAKLLWRDLHVRDAADAGGGKQTRNVRIDILVEGTTESKEWRCGLEFDYANEESIYCRPLRLSEGSSPDRMSVPEEASALEVALLPPMSGLAANETRLDAGAINVRVGEGRTAEVLRNLCYRLVESGQASEAWQGLQERIRQLFGVTLDLPTYVPERGEVTMSYREGSGTTLDLSSAGRGLHQVLLLLAYIRANPKSVLLLDEPDAHLEILRQRQIYAVLTEETLAANCQIVAASHSEVLLNEAAARDVVVAFVGRPHRIDDRGSQVRKALKNIGFEQYYLAEQTGWVLYLEGATDLAILQAFAQRLHHETAVWLAQPFVHYVGNRLGAARGHFRGLREAMPDLVGYALLDHRATPADPEPPLVERTWTRREIENYLCQPETLLAYADHHAKQTAGGPLLVPASAERHRQLMDECIADFVPPAALRDPRDRWWVEAKASDDYLDRVFERFFEKLSLPNLMQKNNYHVLARFVPEELIAPEVRDVLDQMVSVLGQARPPADA